MSSITCSSMTTNLSPMSLVPGGSGSEMRLYKQVILLVLLSPPCHLLRGDEALQTGYPSCSSQSALSPPAWWGFWCEAWRADLNPSQWLCSALIMRILPSCNVCPFSFLLISALLSKSMKVSEATWVALPRNRPPWW